MRLQLRNSKGQKWTIGSTLTGSSSLRDLHQEIQQVTGVDHFSLKFGYPPREISNPPDTVLSDISIRDGELLLLIESTPAVDKNSLVNIPTKNSKNPKDPFHVQFQDVGYLLVREQKDDNSCLFRSIGYVIERNSEIYMQLRQQIAQCIKSSPLEYNEAILERPVMEYCDWIQKMTSWGGAIELSIFSSYFKIEIDSIDISTLRVDRFGQGNSYDKRVILLYSGIHYDAVALAPTLDSNQEFDTTQFPTHQEEYLTVALTLAQQLKNARKFTDLANFTLKCEICKIGLKGQKEAQAHAMESGHAQFSEY